MVAILVPQPDETAGDPALDLATPSRRRATHPHPRPVDLVGVEPLRPRPVRRALPDRSTRVRRRRLVALLLAVALVGAIATAGRALLGAAATVQPSSPQPVEAPARPPVDGQTYLVKPGDTLWSIAAAIAPDSDPRPVVDALREQNGGPDLQVGERLTIRTD
ncbi:MAG TPA: LysM domain-containing protein [Acidimicrobiales bacterium]|nr:LysM domain-containing protein [Acidimicrobiales bacterium]